MSIPFNDLVLNISHIQPAKHVNRYFDEHRKDLLAVVYVLLRPLGYVDLANKFLLQLFLFGDKDFPDLVISE